MSSDQAVYDPIRFCVFTTVALLAWVFGAPAAVTVMSGLGLWAYWHSWRRGLRVTKCVLRDPRIAMGYLALAFVLGVIFSLKAIVAYVS